MKCPICNKPVCAVDYPIYAMGNYYHVEDTEWVVYPEDDDPGVIGAKAGAVPIDVCGFGVDYPDLEDDEDDILKNQM